MNFFPFLLLNFQETPASAFDDVGKLLVGGTIAAIVLAIGFTVVRLRLREKKAPTTNFISISSAESETSAK